MTLLLKRRAARSATSPMHCRMLDMDTATANALALVLLPPAPGPTVALHPGCTVVASEDLVQRFERDVVLIQLITFVDRQVVLPRSKQHVLSNRTPVSAKPSIALAYCVISKKQSSILESHLFDKV